jgi:hypothetical protein
MPCCRECAGVSDACRIRAGPDRPLPSIGRGGTWLGGAVPGRTRPWRRLVRVGPGRAVRARRRCATHQRILAAGGGDPVHRARRPAAMHARPPVLHDPAGGEASTQCANPWRPGRTPSALRRRNARGGTRTPTLLRATTFKVAASTNWATRAGAHRTVSVYRRTEHVFVLSAGTPAAPYAYLLGVYLGDGCISAESRHILRLAIACDAAYPVLLGRIVETIRLVQPSRTVRLVPTLDRCVMVVCTSPHWAELFPQHGPGRKHTRTIALEDWQRTITHRHAESLVRGLIHSDGSRFVARQPKGGHVYSYPRYSFSNRSDDIKNILCEHLDLLGVAWTRPNAHQIQIARRLAVSRLDEFIGPKR